MIISRWRSLRNHRQASRQGGEDNEQSIIAADDGRAIIEVVFLSVLLFIPLIYALIAVLSLQSATFAVAQAARDVGRLIETSTHLPTQQAALDVANIALADHRVHTEDVRLRFVAPGEDCTTSPEIVPSRLPGSRYDACVVTIVILPAIPTVLAGSNNTVTGSYTIVMSDLREGPGG